VVCDRADGGIVADSDPASEWEETLNKRHAVVAMVQTAKQAPLHLLDDHVETV
jgi:anthranilate/para-aminobenzoate synthase component I